MYLYISFYIFIWKNTKLLSVYKLFMRYWITIKTNISFNFGIETNFIRSVANNYLSFSFAFIHSIQCNAILCITVDHNCRHFTTGCVAIGCVCGDSLPVLCAVLILAAQLEWVGTEFWVSFGVFCQMVGPHEPFVTEGTDKVLLSGMCPVMSGQFIAPCKPFATHMPCAFEWAFTWTNVNKIRLDLILISLKLNKSSFSSVFS